MKPLQAARVLLEFRYCSLMSIAIKVCGIIREFKGIRSDRFCSIDSIIGFWIIFYNLAPVLLT